MEEEKPWELFEKSPPLVRLLGTAPDQSFQSSQNENTRYAIRSSMLKDCQYTHSSSMCSGCQFLFRSGGLQNVRGYIANTSVSLETWALAVAAACMDILSEDDHVELMDWVRSRLPPTRHWSPSLWVRSLWQRPHRGRIAILAMGSRGDVQPCAALAIGLQAAGFTVRMFVPRPLHEFLWALDIDAIGVPAGWAGFDMTAVALASGEYEEAMYKGIVDFSPELILYSILGCVEAWVAAESTGALTMHFSYVPYGMHQYPLWRQKMGHCVLFDRLLGRRTLRGWNAAEVKRHSGGELPMLWALSRHLADTSAALHRTHTTGYWTLDAELQRAQLEKKIGFFGSARQQQELTQFLEASEPPVYMGWGSLEVDREKTSQLAVRSLAKTGKRAIVLSGAAGLEEAALHSAADADELLRYARDNVLWLQSAAHEVILPKCSMAVIHGGAGTTAAALRAGLPCVVVPVAYDQPGWAKRVEMSGVGKATNNVREVTTDELASAMMMCMEPQVRAEAARMAERLRQEDGVRNAVDVIKEYLNSQRSSNATSVAAIFAAAQAAFNCLTPSRLALGVAMVAALGVAARHRGVARTPSSA